MIDIDIDPELRTIAKRLDALSDDLRTKGLRTALVGYTRPIKDQIKGNIRHRTGALKKSIGHRGFTKREKMSLGYRGNDVVLAVGATRKVSDPAKNGKKLAQGYKLNWLDAGVDPHDITPKKKGGFLKIGRTFARSAWHKGFAPRRILDRALTASRSASVTAFDKALTRFMDKHK